MSSPSENGASSSAGPFPGRYFDGQTATAHEVRILLCGDTMCVYPSGAEGENEKATPRATWPYAMMEIAAGGKDDPDLLLRCTGMEGRIKLQGRKAAEALLRRAPHLQHRPFARPGQFLFRAMLFVLLLLLGGSLYLAIPKLSGMAAGMLPFSFRDALGRQAWNALTQEGQRLCGNARALQSLLAKLLGDDEQAAKITIGIVDSPRVNALALPGGRILVYRGLIEKAGELGDDDAVAALAGVLAHETGHIRALHPTAAFIRQLGLANFFSLIFANSTLANIVGMATNLSYSRDMERAADGTAITLLERAGIPTGPLARLLRLMNKQPGSDGLKLPVFLSTHPGTEERIDKLSAADIHGRKTARTLQADWKAIKAACNG